MTATTEIRDIDVTKTWVLESTLNFTRYFFKHNFGKKFIVNGHHKIICDALDRVIEGKTKRLMINLAPRYSKCVDPETSILTEDGAKLAKDVNAGDMLYTFDNGKAVLERCLGFEGARKRAIKIRMRSGREITCSYDHPMLTTFGYKEVQNIKVGERIKALRADIKEAICITDNFPYEIIRREKLTYKTNTPPFRCVSTKNITRPKFERLAKEFECLKKYIDEDFYLDEVVEKSELGEIDLIHLEVNRTKNFIANGLVSHNTELVIKNFAAYGFAINPASKFIHLSYSADLATDNSTEVQNTVTSEPFQELFDLELTSNSKKKWKTTEGGGFYAISSGGQVTGFGAGEVQELDEKEQKELEDKELQEIEEFIPFFDSKFAGAILIDDPIKPDDALSDTKRNAVNLKFDTTIRNRVNSRDTPIIIIMQRLHMSDLCGYLQELEGVIGKDEDGEWELVELPCLTTDPETGEDVALWPHKHTVEELHKMRLKNPFVFETQYQMNPKPKEGLMYERGFREYDYPTIPYTPNNVWKNYTDTADTGADYLCSINYVESDLGNFVTDVLFTTKPMEYTEVKTAEMLAKENIVIANIESNNGGRSFGRSVESQTRVLGNYTTEFNAFHQSENKNVRIFTKSNEVQNLTFFPRGWQNMWPDFYQHVTTYMKTGNNKHDDGPDTLTGMVEMRGQSEGESAEGFFA